MLRTRFSVPLPIKIRVGAVLALAGVVGSIIAQEPPRGRGPGGRGQGMRRQGSGVPTTFVTFPNLPKTVTFPFQTLDHTKFNSTMAYVATLPKGFGGVLKKDQQVLFMCYGWKKGGNTRLYETPAVPGLTPEKMTHLIADARIFKDVNRDDKWQVKGTTINGIFVTSTSNDNGVNDAALAALTTKHWLR